MIRLRHKIGEPGYIPDSGTILGESRQLLLHAVHAVDTVNEQNKDEDECNLKRG